MIYEFKCNFCGAISEIHMSVEEYDIKKDLLKCSCDGKLEQVYSPSRIITRTSFPRNFISEHVAKEPVKIRDEKHFRAVAEQNDLVVSNPWDGV